MYHSFLEEERLYLADPTDPRIRRNASELDRIIAALTGPELLAFAMLCAIGLTAVVALCFLVPGCTDGALWLQIDRLQTDRW
jgi:hypothetical protein